MRDLLLDYDRFLASGVPFGRAVVTSVWGSAPRAEGSSMLATRNGMLAGSVSGGCVESATAEEIAAAMERGTPALVTFGVSDERAWEVGLACGGTIKVFVEPAVRPEVLAAARSSVGEVIATAIAGPQVGASARVFEDGRVEGALGEIVAPDALRDAALNALRREGSRTETFPTGAGDLAVFLEVFPRQPRLVIFGGVHVAVALVPFAKALGYRTIVADGRQSFLTRQRFPEADELILAWPEEAFDRIGLDRSCYICILSHDPKFDEPALRVALRSQAMYVGAIGSRKTQASRREWLRSEGFSEAEIARLHGPIGLDLGGRQPAETALAILAEMTVVRYGRADGQTGSRTVGQSDSRSVGALGASPDVRYRGKLLADCPSDRLSDCPTAATSQTLHSHRTFRPVSEPLAYSPDILIVRFSAIGDILLTTPLIRALRARHPGAVITMLTKRQYAPLVSDNPNLDEVIGITRKDSLFRIGNQIRRANYTHRLDLHGNLRTLVLKELSPGHWYSYSQRRVARYFLIRSKRNLYQDDTPVPERYFEAAEDLDVEPDGGPPEFFLGAEAQARGDAWLAHAGIGHGRPLVVIAPGAAHETKRWPVDHWVKLTRQILGTGADIVVIGGPDDSAIAGEIVARSGGAVASGAGLLGLQQTGAVLKKAAALISGDTGAMHMATGLNVPVVALFGPTVRQFGFFPYNAIATVVERDIPCRPCTPHGGPECPLEHHYCMRQILPDAVMTALSRILS